MPVYISRTPRPDLQPELRRFRARLVAHELGHVLLRSSAHDSSGLMKGVWAKSDWQRAAVTIIPFTPDQARWVLQELLDGRRKRLPYETH
jgi:hypothetical protein